MKKIVTTCAILVFALTCGIASASSTYLQDFSNPSDPLIKSYLATVSGGICTLQSAGDENAVVGINTTDFGITFGDLLSGSVKVRGIDSGESLPYFYFTMDADNSGTKNDADPLIIQTDSSLTGPDAQGWSTLSFNLNTTAGISTLADPTNHGPYQSLGDWMGTYGDDKLWRVYVGLGSLVNDYSNAELDDLQFTAVPVPGAILLGGIGISLVGWLRRRRTL